VAERTVGRMHNRAVEIPFEAFCRAGLTESRSTADISITELQRGLHNYCAMLHALWPQDYSGLVLHRVLFEARWAETTGLDDK